MKSAVVLITGASSGIGEACARHLRTLGHVVYNGSRRNRHAPGEHELQLDVTNDADVERALAAILERDGRLDVLVNCAGFGVAGPVEKIPIADAKAQFETNFFGALRMANASLPHMRRQGAGLIVNISSLGGLMGLPYQGLYAASKFALEGLTESLRMEVARFGVRVVLIEPGDFRTSFTEGRIKIPLPEGDPYAPQFARAVRAIERDERNGWPPERIGHLLARLIRDPSPTLRYPVGPYLQRLAAMLRLILPFSLYSKLMLDHFESAAGGE